MKKIMFFITLIVCLVTNANAQVFSDEEWKDVNAQVLSYEEWKEVAKDARVIHFYSEINENDSVIDLRYLDHGIMCCKYCIRQIANDNYINEMFQTLYTTVNSNNATKCYNLFCEVSHLLIKKHELWLKHLKGNNCRRGRLDEAMYAIIAKESLERSMAQREITYRKIKYYL